MDHFGVESTPAPVHFVCSLMHIKSYAIWTAPLPTDAIIDTWNAALSPMFSGGASVEFPTVGWIDISSAVPAGDVGPDNVHPNDAGQIDLALVISAAMASSPLLPARGDRGAMRQGDFLAGIQTGIDGSISTGDLYGATRNILDDGAGNLLVGQEALQGNPHLVLGHGSLDAGATAGMVFGAATSAGTFAQEAAVGDAVIKGSGLGKRLLLSPGAPNGLASGSALRLVGVNTAVNGVRYH